MFDREVTVSGSPQVDLTIGSQTKQATSAELLLCLRDTKWLNFEYGG